MSKPDSWPLYKFVSVASLDHGRSGLHTSGCHQSTAASRQPLICFPLGQAVLLFEAYCVKFDPPQYN